MACVGNSSEYCGGPDALNVYNHTGTGTSSTTTTTTTTSTTTSTTTTSTTTTTTTSTTPTPTGPIVPPSVGKWVSLGCYKFSSFLPSIQSHFAYFIAYFQ